MITGWTERYDGTFEVRHYAKGHVPKTKTVYAICVGNNAKIVRLHQIIANIENLKKQREDLIKTLEVEDGAEGVQTKRS